MNRRLVLVAVLAATAAAISGCAALPTAGSAGSYTNTGSRAGVSCTATTIPGLNPTQVTNARVIASVAVGLGLGRPGVLLGILTAMVETDLQNLPNGDRDSVGLFQQRRAGWSTSEDRHDPVTATTMFFKGGKEGAPGVLSHPGWETMDPGQAMQQTQQSQFQGGDSPGYAAKLATATAATDALVCSTTQPPGAPAGTGLGGRIVAAAETQLGVRYSWGGGTVTGPSVGIRDGGVADSFGDWHEVGWDCSSLVRYAVYTATQGRIEIPRTASEQRTAGQPVPADLTQMIPGDLIVFGVGHVGIFVGGGRMINAPESGSVVRYDTLTGTTSNSNPRSWTVRRITEGNPA